MSLFRRLVMIALLLCAVASLCARAQQANTATSIPRIVTISGELKNEENKPASGDFDVTFLLFEGEDGGAPLWHENQRLTLDREGHFSVSLGASTTGGVPLELFASSRARWLEIEPQGLPVPARVLLLSVPYAAKAGDAETISGLPASAFLRADALPRGTFAAAQSHPATAPGGSGTANYLPLWTPNGSTLGNSALFQSGSAGDAKIGINTSSPAADLDVNGNEIVRGGLLLSATALAIKTKAAASAPLIFGTSAINSSSNTAVFPTFQWQANPVGNNTPAPGAALNLRYGTLESAPETGLSIASNGRITFAPGQTFPGTGIGTITGVTAGAGLSGGGKSGSVKLSLDTTKVPQLNTANTFTGDQAVVGGLSASKLHVNGTASFSGLVTFATGQTFPGAGGGTITAVSPGAGLIGGGSSGGVTLGIDTTKVPLLNSANTFTAPITFASGQTFPGSITGVTAGTGLSGGGTSGSPTLSLDTSYSDGRYPRLGANNTFTGTQIINNAVGIGITPAVPLHVNGWMRAETGLSLGGNASLQVDAPGIIGGHLLVTADGLVGIGNSNPKNTLDVGGNISTNSGVLAYNANISGPLTAGTVQIGSDTAMSAAPHMYLTGYVQGALSATFGQVPIISIPSKNILVTRMVALGINTCSQSAALTVDLATGSGTLQTLTLNGPNGITDSGGLSIAIAAGTPFWGRLNAINCGTFGIAPSNIAISIEYVMQ